MVFPKSRPWAIFCKNMRTLNKPMEVLLVPPTATPREPNSFDYFCQKAPALEGCLRSSAKLQLSHGHLAMVDRTLGHGEINNCGSAK